MAKLPWKPWHEVVRLRDDLRSGELTMQMFAADLYEVMMQRGKQPVYEDQASFFALTFPTHNLRGLVRDVVLRLAGKNDKAVRQLQLTYGGGKTHTLITLRHLVHSPETLPDLPAVQEFIQSIGERPSKALVAGLCFDKLDVEKGMEVRGPGGETRVLKQPWSVLAYQIAGDDGLRLLHAENRPEERDSAPAELLLTQLLEMPVKKGLGVLVLIDEVLMYAREKAGQDPRSKDRLVNFFQYLTQAATKVNRCCIVASLLATDPAKSDPTGRQLLSELSAIFEREREEAVEPVVKEDVAEVLRRRFFTPESIKDKDAFKPHVIAALKGIADVDEQTRRQGSQAEERFLRSYPFHPDLTEVLYSKWTQLKQFQRTRGVLRTFALALRQAEKWDTSPLIGPAVFLAAPDSDGGLSDAARELVAVADTEGHEGEARVWTGILATELDIASRIQKESAGLRYREIEQAVFATFLHSQPVGQSVRTRDLEVLLAATRPDRIELEKGLSRWAQSSFWLDDTFTREADKALPSTWRMGNRPNLVQMHAVAAKSITEDMVRARLLDEIARARKLTEGASAAGVRVHTLPTRPRDIEDDGGFHYAVLGPAAASDSGKPSAEAKKFLDETTGPEKPRVFRNALILLVPSREGLEVAEARVRDYLAWEKVRDELNREQHGNVDEMRMRTLAVQMEKARGRIPEAIRQAYCIVVTVSEANENQAFKISVSDDPHFTTIKADKRSRIQDTPISAEALLPGGPYNLWRERETTRRVKDLAGAFAQLPHLPKMLKAQAILDTLVDGCERGSFVLKLTRPDRTFRTWWKCRPDEDVLADPALELVLPQAAELGQIAPELLAPKALPGLWSGDEVSVGAVRAYFDGTKVVHVRMENYEEPMQIPKAPPEVVYKAIEEAVQAGVVWMTSGPTSVFGEPVPAGTLTDAAVLRLPPKPIPAPDILPENLPDAWKDGAATALSIATALSQKLGHTLPWKTVRDVIHAALQARFLELMPDSGTWPCDFPAAQTVKLTMATGGRGGGGGGERPKVRIAAADLEAAEFQDFADALPKLLQVKAKTNVPIGLRVEVSVGDGKTDPPAEAVESVNELLARIKEDFRLA